MTHPQGLPPYPAPEELEHATWFKATASNGGTGCVEVAHLASWTVIRDSKNPDGPVHATRRTNGRAPRLGTHGEPRPLPN